PNRSRSRWTPLAALSTQRSVDRLASHCCLPFRSRRHGSNFRALARSLACTLCGALGLSCGLWSRGYQPQALADFGLKLRSCVFVVFQELAGVFAALSDALSLIAVPGAGFFQNVVICGQIQQIA